MKVHSGLRFLFVNYKFSKIKFKKYLLLIHMQTNYSLKYPKLYNDKNKYIKFYKLLLL